VLIAQRMRARHFARRDQTQCHTAASGAAGPADPMQVYVGVARQFVVDDRGKILDVEATRRHIACRKHAATAVGEAQQNLVAIALFHVAMQCQRAEAETAQRGYQFFGIATHVAEHHRRFRPVRQ